MLLHKLVPPDVTHVISFTKLPMFFSCNVEKEEEPGYEATFSTAVSTLVMLSISLAGQPLHKRGRVWCHAHTRLVLVVMQFGAMIVHFSLRNKPHARQQREDLAPDWSARVLGAPPGNRSMILNDV